MEGSPLDFERPIADAISKIRFAPNSNNLLVSSWDSVLRLYDVDGAVMRLEAQSDGALLDCCFRDELTAFSASSDGCVRRYDLFSATQTIVGQHDDSIIYVECSESTGQVITAGLDKKLLFTDILMKNGEVGSIHTDSDMWSLSVSGYHLMTAIGRRLDVYDLRSLKLPAQSEDFSKKYQIWCVRSSPGCQGYAVGSIEGCVDLKYFDSAKDTELGNDDFVTGDNEGYAIIWNAKRRKRLFELGRYPNSVASLSFNQGGQLLAVASSHTYQEAAEMEKVPQMFILKWDDLAKPGSSGK